MSSIERAMSKLAGEEHAPDTEQPSTSPSAAPPANDIPVPGTVAAAELTTSVGADGFSAPDVSLNSSVTKVQLDLERMAAAGFLCPNQPMTRESEEYQQIKRRLLGNMTPELLQKKPPSNLILITSSVPNEGKTFTVTNLAMSLAMEVDHTVLVIDTDIMKRDLSKIFLVSDRLGLFDLLSNPKLKLEDLLVRTSIPNLVILPAGFRSESSTELLASLRMKELTEELSRRYADRVLLFDSPPVLATTTAAAIAPFMGQVLLVAEAGKTKHETVLEGIARLDQARITGMILNKAKQQMMPSYDYYHS